MGTTTHRMNYDRYCLLPEDGFQHEVLDGYLVMTPAPTPKHQEVVMQLATLLNEYAKSRLLGKVYVSPIDVLLDPHMVLQPDVLFIRAERLHIVGPEAIEGAPDLAVEVVSRSTLIKDRVRKLAIYSEYGVQEYWIVDPAARTVELYTRMGDALKLAATLGSDDTFSSPLLAGLQIPISRIF